MFNIASFNLIQECDKFSWINFTATTPKLFPEIEYLLLCNRRLSDTTSATSAALPTRKRQIDTVLIYMYADTNRQAVFLASAYLLINKSFINIAGIVFMSIDVYLDHP